MGRFIALWALGLIVAALLGCGESESIPVSNKPPADVTPDVIAQMAGGDIRLADLDAYILALPAARRPQPGDDLEIWYQERIQELAVERLLKAEAEQSGLADSEAFLHQQQLATRQFTLKLCLAQLLPSFQPLDRAELQTAYEARRSQLTQPERRLTFHLFRRLRPDLTIDDARAELNALRDRVLYSEPFQRVAAQYSDSESRYRQGGLGWIRRGQLPAELEQVVFTLDEGVPSEPVQTQDGLHLFYIENTLPERQLSFEEARPLLKSQLQNERWEQSLAELAATLEPLPQQPVNTREELAALLQSGSQNESHNTIVLRSPDTEISLQEFMVQLRQTLAVQNPEIRAGNRLPVALAWQFLTRLQRQEQIYQHCQGHEIVSEDALAPLLRKWRQPALTALQRQHRMREIAQQDEARLELFYQSNLGRFSTAPTWHLQRISVPLTDDAVSLMGQLEEAVQQGRSVAELQRAFDARTEDLGWHTLDELRDVSMKLAERVTQLAAGDLSAPYRSVETLDLVKLLERRDAESLPFADVRERVVTAYLEQYTHEIYAQLSTELLQSADLQIISENLALLHTDGLPQADVSVEQLEQLLNEL